MYLIKIHLVILDVNNIWMVVLLLEIILNLISRSDAFLERGGGHIFIYPANEFLTCTYILIKAGKNSNVTLCVL